MKAFRTFFFVFLLLFVAAPIAVRAESAAYTLLVYMVGSDLESEQGMASSDLREMMASGFDADRVNVVVCAGGTTRWQMDIDPSAPQMLHVTPEGLESVATLSAQSMCDPDTLAGFLRYGHTQYPAERYGLILWNHGGGPVNGYGIDTQYDNDALTLPALSAALAASPFDAENPLSFIGFDACLMASIETAHAVASHAQYMIASQEVEPSFGWDYGFIPQLAEGEAGDAVGRRIIDEYTESTHAAYAALQMEGFLPDLTLSCLDLRHMDAVEEALEELFSTLDTSLSLGSFIALSRARSNTKDIGSFTTGRRLDLVDLGDMLRALAAHCPQETQTLWEALQRLVVYNRTNVEKATGISIYYPFDDTEYYAEFGQALYDDLHFAPAYAQYLREYTSIKKADGFADWNQAEMPVQFSEDRLVTMMLSDEQAANLLQAQFIVLEALSPKEYRQVFVTKEVERTGNTLQVLFDGTLLLLATKENPQGVPALFWEQDRTEQYIRGSVACLLVYEDYTSDDMADWVLEYESAYMNVLIDRATRDAFIVGAKPASSDDPFMGKNEIDLAAWKRLQTPTYSRVPVYGESGELLPYYDWISTGMVYLYEHVLSEKLVAYYGQLAAEEYPLYGMFVLTDVHGRQYASELILLEEAAEKADSAPLDMDAKTHSIVIDTPIQHPALLWESGNMRVALENIALDASAQPAALVATLSLQNASGEEMSFQIPANGVYANGYAFQAPGVHSWIPAGGQCTEQLKIDLEHGLFAYAGAQDLASLELFFEAYPSADPAKKEKGHLHLVMQEPVPLAYPYPTRQNAYQFLVTPRTLAQTDDAMLELVGLRKGYSAYEVIVLLTNHSDQAIALSVSRSSADGVMVRAPSVAHKYIRPQRRGYIALPVDEGSLVEAGILQPKELLMDVSIVSYDAPENVLATVRFDLPVQPASVHASQMQPMQDSEAAPILYGPYKKNQGYTSVCFCYENETSQDVLFLLDSVWVNDRRITSIHDAAVPMYGVTRGYGWIDMAAEELALLLEEAGDDRMEKISLQYRILDGERNQVILQSEVLSWEVP